MKNLFKSLVIFSIYFFSFGCNSQMNKLNKVKTDRGGSVEIFNDSISKSVKGIIDKKATETLQDSLIHSLSIGVYINNVSYTFHYGELTIGKGDTPTNETIYEIASVTKTFTGTLAAKAIIEGKLDLNDDIRKYLPEAFLNLEYNEQPIRIKHLLTHTSGLPSGVGAINKIPSNLGELRFNKAYLQIADNLTKRDFFAYLSEIKITTAPGKVFNYSNFGSNLMGYILEVIYKKPFQELVIEQIIKKVGMKNTYFTIPKNKIDHLANGYLLETPMPEGNLANTLWGAEGALKSTTKDMLKYIHYQLQENDMVKESHRKLYEIDSDYWIGYFWWCIENQNHEYHFRHDGGISRAKNVLVIYPENKIGISIITNQSSKRINQKLSELTYSIYNSIKY